MHGTLRKTAGAVSFEPSLAPMLKHDFGEDAPRRVARAEKENVVRLAGHRLVLTCAAGWSAARLRRGRLRRQFRIRRLAAPGTTRRFPQFRQRAFAIDRGLAIGEESFPRHALRIGDPLLVGL